MQFVVDTKMTKSAGEHWVCSVLARYGWAAALTRDGLERTDILAVQASGSSRLPIEVQVKALNDVGPRSSWPLGTKSQQPSLSDYEWYALVLLGKDPCAAPRTFIMPRDHIAAAAWIRHMEWLTDSTVAPGQRNVGPDRSRVEIFVIEAYENRWDLLGLPTSEAPILLPHHFRELALTERVGLPPGHPWHQNLPEW